MDKGIEILKILNKYIKLKISQTEIDIDVTIKGERHGGIIDIDPNDGKRLLTLIKQIKK